MTYQPGDTLEDKYRIEELIGRGAFAEVYRATHIELNVPRALKVLRKDTPGVGSSLFEDYEQRFKLEVQLGARINHPNVIQVHDIESHGDDLILVMEYAPGGSLAERIGEYRDTGKYFEIEDALQIAADVAAGLGELHALDAVHRDLKPSNILFDAKGRSKVADFGLAQIPGGASLRSQLSQPMSHPGTPGYMSPEQEDSGKYLRPASDVYALGLILFEMLTGRNYKNVERGSGASAFRKGLPAWLDKILLQMLADNPDQRSFDGTKAARLLRDGQRRLSKRGKGLPKPRLGKLPGWAWFLIGGLVLAGLVVGLVLTGNYTDDLTERWQDTPVAKMNETTSVPELTASSTLTLESTLIITIRPPHTATSALTPKSTNTFTPVPRRAYTPYPTNTLTIRTYTIYLKNLAPSYSGENHLSLINENRSWATIQRESHTATSGSFGYPIYVPQGSYTIYLCVYDSNNKVPTSQCGSSHHVEVDRDMIWKFLSLDSIVFSSYP